MSLKRSNSKTLISLLTANVIVLSITSAVAAKQGLTEFSGACLPPYQSPRIQYANEQSHAQYYISVPDDFSHSESFGLIVYTSPHDVMTSVPNGWESVLKKHKLLFVAAQGVGNDCGSSQKRLAFGIRGAVAMMNQYRINPGRVYAAGLSGGARVASDLALLQPDIFHGTIQDCGSNYFRPVKQVFARIKKDTQGFPYGTGDANAEDAFKAKGQVRFALITGPNDFRRGNILDIYNEGFARDGFQARLFDINGMGHEDCSADTLDKVLGFIDTGR